AAGELLEIGRGRAVADDLLDTARLSARHASVEDGDSRATGLRFRHDRTSDEDRPAQHQHIHAAHLTSYRSPASTVFADGRTARCSKRRRRRELVTTKTELNAIANPAISGDSNP